MSQFRSGLHQLAERSQVSIVGRASCWKRLRGQRSLCIDHYVVEIGEDCFFEEHHVHVDFAGERIDVRPGDWIEVKGRVYNYEQSTQSGAIRENYSIEPSGATLLWRPADSTGADVAYWYANQINLVNALRNGSIPEWDEHFSTNGCFDPLFEERVESREGDGRWEGRGKSVWFFKVAMAGPFVDWNTYKRDPTLRPRPLRDTRKLRRLRNDLVYAGSRPSEWRFPRETVGSNRWLSIEPLLPVDGQHRSSRLIVQRL
jgi:hypothetical protein